MWGYGTTSLSQRPQRPRMATVGTPVTSAQRRAGVADHLPETGDRDAIRYVLRTGCSWRMLPHDLPPWRIVFHYFRTWRRDGTWQRAHGARQAAAGSPQRGHHRQPVGKDHGKRGPRYDAGKKVKGRKRHIVVDTLGAASGGGASG